MSTKYIKNRREQICKTSYTQVKNSMKSLFCTDFTRGNYALK